MQIGDIATTILDVVREVIWALLKLPFTIWYMIPQPVKYIIYGLILALTLTIIILIIKTRKDIYRIM